MYGVNIVCKFTTSKGSLYKIEEHTVWRDKKAGLPDDGVHYGQKNIYYTDHVGAQICLLKRHHHHFKVTHSGNLATITFNIGSKERKEVALTLQREPKEGLQPVDMVLNWDGSASERPLFHVGHAITEIHSRYYYI